VKVMHCFFLVNEHRTGDITYSSSMAGCFGENPVNCFDWFCNLCVSSKIFLPSDVMYHTPLSC